MERVKTLGFVATAFAGGASIIAAACSSGEGSTDGPGVNPTNNPDTPNPTQTIEITSSPLVETPGVPVRSITFEQISEKVSSAYIAATGQEVPENIMLTLASCNEQNIPTEGYDYPSTVINSCGYIGAELFRLQTETQQSLVGEAVSDMIIFTEDTIDNLVYGGYLTSEQGEGQKDIIPVLFGLQAIDVPGDK